MDLARPESPAPATRGAFSYDARRGCRAYGHARALVEPAAVGGKDRAWVVAQLAHHGVAFRPEADDASLRETLLSLARENDALQVPPDIKALVEDLRSEYVKQLMEHRVALLAWRELKFASLPTPTEEAKFDVAKFVAKYFLEDDGSPAPFKTAEALVLDVAPMAELQDFAESTRGLRMLSTYSVTIIGWDHNLAAGVDRAFASIDRPGNPLDVPTCEAMFDAPRFLQKHFVDEDIRPMPAKTPKPIQLGPVLLDSHKESLARFIQIVPPLAMADIVSTWGRYTIVGWEKEVNAHKEHHMVANIPVVNPRSTVTVSRMTHFGFHDPLDPALLDFLWLGGWGSASSDSAST